MSARRRSRFRSVARDKSRADILAAAMQLFAEHGLENVTIGRIAKVAGVSRPLIYFHFTDPRTLFLECLLGASEELHRRLVAAIQSSGTGLDQIEAMGRAYMQFNVDDRAAFQILAMGEAQPPARGRAKAVYERIEVHHQAIDALLTGMIRRGMTDGSIRREAGGPQEVSVCLWGFTHGLAQLMATKGEHLCLDFGLDPEKTIATGFALLRAGLSGIRG